MSGQLRLGPANDWNGANKALQDIQQYLNQSPHTPDTPPISGIAILVQASDGAWQLWTLVAGAGITLTPNVGAQTLTITSP